MRYLRAALKGLITVVGFAQCACRALGEHFLIAVNFNLSDAPSAQDYLK